MVVLRQCYSCDMRLEEENQFNEWDMHNVDGGQHPLCWGCSEKMYEYTQDAMAERGRGEDNGDN